MIVILRIISILMWMQTPPALEEVFIAQEKPGKRKESIYIPHQLGMSGLVSFAGLFLAT